MTEKYVPTEILPLPSKLDLDLICALEVIKDWGTRDPLGQRVANCAQLLACLLGVGPTLLPKEYYFVLASSESILKIRDWWHRMRFMHHLDRKLYLIHRDLLGIWDRYPVALALQNKKENETAEYKLPPEHDYDLNNVKELLRWTRIGVSIAEWIHRTELYSLVNLTSKSVSSAKSSKYLSTEAQAKAAHQLQELESIKKTLCSAEHWDLHPSKSDIVQEWLENYQIADSWDWWTTYCGEETTVYDLKMMAWAVEQMMSSCLCPTEWVPDDEDSEEEESVRKRYGDLKVMSTGRRLKGVDGPRVIRKQ